MIVNYVFDFDNKRYCMHYAILPNGEVYYESLQVETGDKQWERVLKLPKGFKANLEDLFEDEIAQAKGEYAADHNDYSDLRIDY